MKVKSWLNQDSIVIKKTCFCEKNICIKEVYLIVWYRKRNFDQFLKVASYVF